MEHIQIRQPVWSTLFFLLTGTFCSFAEGAVSTETQARLASVPQQMLYRLTCEDLDELKDSLVQVNLHMRESADGPPPVIRVAVFGEAVRFFKKSGIDPELKFMLDWFWDEDVQVGVDREWLVKTGFNPEDLVDGLVVMEFHSSPPEGE